MARPAAARKARDEIKDRLRRRRRALDAPEGFLSRAQLLTRVGITEGQLRSILALQIVGNDGVNREGRVVYSEKTAQRLLTMKADGSLFRMLDRASGAVPVDAVLLGPATYSPEQGVRVFEMLHEGYTLEQIILELGKVDNLRIHPAVAKRIQSDYLDISTAILLPSIAVDRINKLTGLPGSFPLRDAQGVLDVLEGCVAARLCPNCREHAPATWCITCINDDALMEQRRSGELAEPPPQPPHPPHPPYQAGQNGNMRPDVRPDVRPPPRRPPGPPPGAALPVMPRPSPPRPPPAGANALLDDDDLPPIDGKVRVPAIADADLPGPRAPAPLPPELLRPPEE